MPIEIHVLEGGFSIYKRTFLAILTMIFCIQIPPSSMLSLCPQEEGKLGLKVVQCFIHVGFTLLGGIIIC